MMLYIVFCFNVVTKTFLRIIIFCLYSFSEKVCRMNKSYHKFVFARHVNLRVRAISYLPRRNIIVSMQKDLINM